MELLRPASLRTASSTVSYMALTHWRHHCRIARRCRRKEDPPLSWTTLKRPSTLLLAASFIAAVVWALYTGRMRELRHRRALAAARLALLSPDPTTPRSPGIPLPRLTAAKLKQLLSASQAADSVPGRRLSWRHRRALDEFYVLSAYILTTDGYARLAPEACAFVEQYHRHLQETESLKRFAAWMGRSDFDGTSNEDVATIRLRAVSLLDDCQWTVTEILRPTDDMPSPWRREYSWG